MAKTISIKEKITGFSHLNFDYWFFFFIVLMLGRSTAFICNLDPRTQPLSFIALMLTSFVLLRKTNNLGHSSNYVVVLLFFIPWVVYHYFEDTAFQYGSYAQLSIKLFVGLILAVHYKESLISYFWRIISLLCTISIPFWIIANIIGIQNLALFAPFDQWLGEGSSFLVYTTLENLDNTSDRAQMLYGSILRNPGFCWEPGRFASSIVLAMTCYIISNKGKIEWKSWAWLSMLVALITTQSTTGYVTFLIMMALHYMINVQVSFSKKLLNSIVMVVVISYALTLPFMQEKIMNNADENTWITQNYEEGWIGKSDRVITVDRSEGLYLDFLNLQYKPIMGYGLAPVDSYVYNYLSQNLTTSNGLLSPLSKLGLLLGIPYFLLFYFGTRKISKKYSKNETYLMFVVAMIFQYSYNYMFEIFFFALALYAITKNTDYSKLFK